MPVPDTFGLRLLRARRQKNLNQEALGAEVGLTGHTIGRLERGESTQISLDALRKIARVLGVSLDWLLMVREPDTEAGPGVDEDPSAALTCDAVESVHT